MKISYIKLRIYLKKILYRKPFIWKAIEVLQGLVYVFDYFYYYKWWGHNNRFSIKEFNIEFASQCNLRCKFCSLDHLKPKTLISEEVLEKTFSSFITDKRFQGIEVINLHNGGEILLHPKRLEMLAIIKKYKDLAKERNIKFPKIYMLSNAMLLREKLSKQILDLNVIDAAGFSMDGGTPSAFEELRENAKWSIFYKNLKNFCHLNKAGNYNVETFSISCIPDNKPLTTDWMNPEFRDALHTLSRFELRRLHNWRGELGDEEKNQINIPNNKFKIGCTLLMRQLVLLPSGDVTVCCNDLNSVGVIGNVLKDDIVSIYKGKERMNYLSLLLKRKKSQLELCKDCQTF